MTAAASPTPKESSLANENRILDDTAVSALPLPNGEKRLFFQDFSGVIRQAFYSSTTGQWRADTGIVVAADAKNNTPLAAINVPTIPNNGSDSTSNIPSIPGGLSIFYISHNNSLACSQFAGGQWNSTGSGGIYFSDISQYTAAPNSRYISVTVLPGKAVRLLDAVVIFESANGNIAMLNGSLNVPPSTATLNESQNAPLAPTDFPFWTWNDVTDKLHDSVQKTTRQFSGPFTIFDQSTVIFAAKAGNGSLIDEALYTSLDGATMVGSEGPNISIQFDNGTSSNETLYSKLSDTTSGLNTFNFSETFGPSLTYDSDLIATSLSDFSAIQQDYGFWINGTQLATFSVGSNGATLPTMPRTPFPFRRMSGFNPANSSKILIYHQLSSSAFAEDQWDASIGGWLYSAFEVGTN